MLPASRAPAQPASHAPLRSLNSRLAASVEVAEESFRDPRPSETPHPARLLAKRAGKASVAKTPARVHGELLSRLPMMNGHRQQRKEANRQDAFEIAMTSDEVVAAPFLHIPAPQLPQMLQPSEAEGKAKAQVLRQMAPKSKAYVANFKAASHLRYLLEEQVATTRNSRSLLRSASAAATRRTAKMKGLQAQIPLGRRIHHHRHAHQCLCSTDMNR